ncbi:unnamed protein product [Arctogadus glacialis]
MLEDSSFDSWHAGDVMVISQTRQSAIFLFPGPQEERTRESRKNTGHSDRRNTKEGQKEKSRPGREHQPATPPKPHDRPGTTPGAQRTTVFTGIRLFRAHPHGPPGGQLAHPYSPLPSYYDHPGPMRPTKSPGATNKTGTADRQHPAVYHHPTPDPGPSILRRRGTRIPLRDTQQRTPTGPRGGRRPAPRFTGAGTRRPPRKTNTKVQDGRPGLETRHRAHPREAARAWVRGLGTSVERRQTAKT